MKLILSFTSILLFSYVGLAQGLPGQPSTSPVQKMAVQEGDEYFPYLYFSDAIVPGMDQDQAKGLIEKCTKVIAKSEKNVLVAYNNRALAYLLTGKLDLAVADLKTALASDPKPDS